MLDAEFGGIRPWELEQFTPDEETALHMYAREINQRREVT
jgi:hypothetical protein